MPIIHNKKVLARSRLFQIEGVELEFENNNTQHFERITSAIKGAVMVVALNASREVALVREYAVGSEQYEVTLPKGAIDQGEEALDAANRELAEEIGLAADKLTLLTTLKIAPAYFKFETWVVLAENLYAKQLEGDEPEALALTWHSIDDINSLLERNDFSEARSIAALFIAKTYLEQQ
jgi:ADP-ribose diphosphatase